MRDQEPLLAYLALMTVRNEGLDPDGECLREVLRLVNRGRRRIRRIAVRN